jgi:lipoyl(octanoyl) transferase
MLLDISNRLNLKVLDLGLIDYRRCYEIQKQCLSDVKLQKEEGFLILCEHHPVFTIGRFGLSENLLISKEEALSRGIEIIKTDRGGDITFHGPGQLVVYPILPLFRIYKDVHRYLHSLEEVVINILGEFGIVGYRIEGRTGVWTDFGKICSIGIGVSRWITYHGIAFNVNVDLSYFDMINPCGFKDIKVTSMKNILSREVDIQLLKERLSSTHTRAQETFLKT